MEDFYKFKEQYKDKRIIVYPEDDFSHITLNWPREEVWCFIGVNGWVFLNLGKAIVIPKEMIPLEEQKNYPITTDEELYLIKGIAKKMKEYYDSLAVTMAQGIIDGIDEATKDDPNVDAEYVKQGMREFIEKR